jgi:hypothetical protein
MQAVNTCRVCKHPRRREIETALLAGTSSRRISAQYADLSPNGVRRHGLEHMPRRLVLASARADEAFSRQLLEQLASMVADAAEILERHKGSDDKLALDALRTKAVPIKIAADVMVKLAEIQQRQSSDLVALAERAKRYEETPPAQVLEAALQVVAEHVREHAGDASRVAALLGLTQTLVAA